MVQILLPEPLLELSMKSMSALCNSRIKNAKPTVLGEVSGPSIPQLPSRAGHALAK